MKRETVIVMDRSGSVMGRPSIDKEVRRLTDVFVHLGGHVVVLEPEAIWGGTPIKDLRRAADQLLASGARHRRLVYVTDSASELEQTCGALVDVLMQAGVNVSVVAAISAREDLVNVQHDAKLEAARGSTDALIEALNSNTREVFEAAYTRLTRLVALERET